FFVNLTCGYNLKSSPIYLKNNFINIFLFAKLTNLFSNVKCKLNLLKPKLEAIHICNSQKPTQKPKIAKEYVLPTLKYELKKKHRKTELNGKKSTTYNNVYKK
ncbi:MAG: hypothetical protein KDC69_12370, partial [Flavobacteriaceae bacterium]|nr:hypothetical protein [Flavobacteriaceae bacterium]